MTKNPTTYPMTKTCKTCGTLWPVSASYHSEHEPEEIATTIHAANLEAAIDSLGLPQVIDLLATICDGKAPHELAGQAASGSPGRG